MSKSEQHQATMGRKNVKPYICKPHTILIIEYANVKTMLSGHSLLAQLDHMDPSRYKAVVIFNRACDLAYAVAQRGHETMIIPHGGGNFFKRAWQYGKLPFILFSLTKRVKPALIHANNVMAGRDAMVLKILTGLPVVIQIRNIGLPPRTAPFVLRADMALN